MAGHSKFKNIMHRKGAQDKKRAKLFNRLGREVTVAVKEGGSDDPGMNPRLRLAILNARSDNMPKDRIEAAIKKGAGPAEMDNYDDMRYEGYGVGGIAIIVDTLTDNKNRTAAEVRAAFTKYAGNLAETGSVSFMFDRLADITYKAETADEEAMFEAALEAGADNCELEPADDENDIPSLYHITCPQEDFGTVRIALEQAFGDAHSTKIFWQPQNLVPISAEHAETLFKMIEVLEDNDDVQEVTANFDLDDETMAKLSA